MAARTNDRVARASTVSWVPVAQLKISEMAQRKLSMAWVNERVPVFDPEALGFIVVNKRSDGDMYVIDGQHRTELLRAVGWGDQDVQCELYVGLTLREEAAEFLRRNDRRAVRPFDQFRVRVTAEEPVACAIVKILAAESLTVALGDGDGRVHAVGALEAVYSGMGLATGKETGQALTRTLRALKEAFGPASTSFQGGLIEGLGLVFLRHKEISRDVLVSKLSKIAGGASGVIGKGRMVRDVKGRSIPQCIASVIVDAYNQGRRGDRLPDWWS